MKITTIAMLGSMVLASTSVFAQDTAAPVDQASIIAAALAGGDAAAGEKVFTKCKACHKIGDGAKNGLGPLLNDVIGRQMGVAEKFKYSNGMKDHSAAGDVWTLENLDAWLTKPKDFIAKTKMSFAGLEKADDRANVIAYLATFSTAAE